MKIKNYRLIPVFLLIGALLAVLALRSTSVTTTTPNTRPFRLGLVGRQFSIDPAFVRTHEEILMSSAIYEPLLRFDQASGTLRPALARTWGYSANGRSIVFMLGSAHFHNGRPVTAEDVKKSWERSLSTGDNPARVNLFSSIEGAEDFYNNNAQDIYGLKAENDQTLRVMLKHPDSAFVYKITNPAFWVTGGAEKDSLPPGTGPFLAAELKPESRFKAAFFNKYYGKTPKVSAVEFIFYNDESAALAAFKEGKLDLLDSVPYDEIKNIQSDQRYVKCLYKTPLFGFCAIGMNVHRHPFNDPVLRRALNYAVNRSSITKSVLGEVGLPQKGVLPQELPGYSQSLRGYSYNPEAANELLDETDYLTSSNPPDIKYAFNSDQGQQRLAEAISAQLSSVGVSTQLFPVSWETYPDKLSTMSYDFFRLGWDADYPDPDAFLYPLFHSSLIGLSNFTAYSNPQVDRLLESARAQTKNNNERIKLLQRAEKIIIDDAPMVWLFQKE
ncbi:MAG: ABC transporter substrate-binding protein, partial [Candidatus Saccharibacteria bacterium]